MMQLIATKYSIPKMELERLYLRYNSELCKGQMSLEDLNNMIDKKFNITGINWQYFYLKAITPDKNVIKACQWAYKHYRVGILTNAFKGNYQALIKNNILPNIFENVVDSSETGLVKPDQDIYQYAQEQVKLNPDEILLVDDRYINILAAQRYGWWGYQVNTNNTFNTLKDLQILLEF